MRKEFRDKIKANFVELVDRIDPHDLAEFLLTKRGITNKECRRIFTDRTDSKHINRLLLFYILKKNDSVYHKFVEALELFGLKHLFSNNNPRAHASAFHEANTPNIEEIPPIQNLAITSEETGTTFTNDRQPLVVKVKLATDFKKTDCDNTYDTKSSKRGQVLIINNKYFNGHHKERRGSEIDIRCLKLLFQQMSMKVEVHEDLDEFEMRKVISQFAKFDADKISDICVVVIMSHGRERNKELVVIDKNNGALRTAWIEEQFNNVNCVLFKDKPKVFLYQFCRGTHYDYATTRRTAPDTENSEFVASDASQTDKPSELDDSIEADSGPIFHVERRLEDMLVGYATQKGHRAHRDPFLGSWYIQLICEVFMEKAHNSHIVEMLNEVDRKLKCRSSSDYTMQTSSYTSNGFNKLLYFNPGIYLDNSNNVQRFV